MSLSPDDNRKMINDHFADEADASFDVSGAKDALDREYMRLRDEGFDVSLSTKPLINPDTPDMTPGDPDKARCTLYWEDPKGMAHRIHVVYLNIKTRPISIISGDATGKLMGTLASFPSDPDNYDAKPKESPMFVQVIECGVWETNPHAVAEAIARAVANPIVTYAKSDISFENSVL